MDSYYEQDEVDSDDVSVGSRTYDGTENSRLQARRNH
jgi:hypothetical protein